MQEASDPRPVEADAESEPFRYYRVHNEVHCSDPALVLR